MNQFSPAELVNLSFARETVIDAQFQFWLTITFAVLVAQFVAGKRLGTTARIAIASLYACAVVVLVSRGYYAAAEANMLRQELQRVGVPLITPNVTLVARLVLLSLGTMGTLVFLLTDWLGNARGGAVSEQQDAA